MKKVTVLPDLVLDEEEYELTRAALMVVAPDVLTYFNWEWFVTPINWAEIPDPNNPELPYFKAECIIKQGGNHLQTIKLNKWEAPDLRDPNEGQWPHNHPWPFVGMPLRGVYEEVRFEVPRLISDRILVDPYTPWKISELVELGTFTHEAGSQNDLRLTDFHEVTAVEPGTLSLMNCNLGRKEGWGHIEEDANGDPIYVPNKQGKVHERFSGLFRERNPHLFQAA